MPTEREKGDPLLNTSILVEYTQNILNCNPITRIQDLCQPQSFRRGLAFGTGFSLLLISIISVKDMWDYFIIVVEYVNIYEILLLIFSAWGISYVVFLWFSFLLIGFRKLPGCAWTAIRRDLHICVDSVLNAKQDIVQEKNGISVELLRTDGSRLWTIGLLGLLVFAYVLTLDSIDLFVKLIFIGSFSSLYFLYDRTIHTPSKHRIDLTGCGDYLRLLRELLPGRGK